MKFRLALFVAAATGFVALSYEILWYRVFSFVAQGAPIVFGALLGFYLIGIAFGSYRSRLYCEAEAEGADATRRALGRFLFLANLVAFLVVPVTGWLVTRAPWFVALLVVALSTALLGAVLPLTSHLAIAPDDRAGARLSYLYLANILGSSAGSLLTGFVLMDYATTRQIAVLLAWAGFLLAGVVVLATETDRRTRRAMVVSVAVASVLVAAASRATFDQLYERLLYRGTFRPETRFAETVENRSGVINVTEDGKVFGGGAYDGVFNTSLVHDQNIIARAYAVGVLHPNPARILMVGLASGSWAKVLASMPGLERFTIVEINPGYLDLIRHHREVAGVLTNPKVDIVIDDGRRWLEAHPAERFDAVVMNTTWHWRAHTTNLLSREFFEIVKRHLLPGGLFYFNTTSSRDACRTAIAEFPHTLRVSNFVAASDVPLGIDPAKWKELLETYRIDGQLALDTRRADDAATLDKLLVFAQPKPVGDVEDERSLAKTCSVGEVITDDNMLPEWRQVLHWEVPR
jgi:spermidine synthase